MAVRTSYINLCQKAFVSDIHNRYFSGSARIYSNQVPKASHSRWSAPHQNFPTQDGQSYQQGTDYNILARRNET